MLSLTCQGVVLFILEVNGQTEHVGEGCTGIPGMKSGRGMMVFRGVSGKFPNCCPTEGGFAGPDGADH